MANRETDVINIANNLYKACYNNYPVSDWILEQIDRGNLDEPIDPNILAMLKEFLDEAQQHLENQQ